MKIFFIILAAFLATAILIGGGQFIPISKNFVYYLWWRTTVSGIAQKGSIRVEGADIYYRYYGNGSPVLLLHGGLSHRLSWFSQVPWLVESGRKVILIDSRGHGDSGLGDNALSYRLLAADAVHVLDQLGIQQTDVIGWSDGANTALLLARYWPQRVGKIVAISGNFDPSGIKSEAHDDNIVHSSGLSYWLKRWWTGAGEQFFELEDKIKHLWQNDPKLKADDLRGITTPIMVIIGEHDLIKLAHAHEMTALLPCSRLEIIPGGGHTTVVTHASQINQLISNFFTLPSNARTKQP